MAIDHERQLLQERDASIAWLAKDLTRPGIVLNTMAHFIKIFG